MSTMNTEGTEKAIAIEEVEKTVICAAVSTNNIAHQLEIERFGSTSNGHLRAKG